MKTAYLALGSNLGERLDHLAAALRQIASDPEIVVKKISSVYETEPFGVVNQPDYFNAVIEIQTELSSGKLLVRALEIETSLGRVRRERWGPRNIDIDLLWYDDERVTTANLSLPHPRMLERGFVLIPLAEIAPELVLDGETIAARVSGLGPTRIRKLDTASIERFQQALRS